MATPFLSSEEYDERAHRLYDEGDYDGALRTLKEALLRYPHSVDLYVGLAYARLAREEFVWAKQAFDKALVLDPDHEDALVGLGEVLLRIGRQDEAKQLFARVRESGCAEDLDVLLSIGRALYRERLFADAREMFCAATELYPNSAEAAAALGYALHRLRDGTGARRQLRRALRLDVGYHEARVYLAHLLYDRGDWQSALEEYERVSPAEHWDPVAIWRVIELKRALPGRRARSSDIARWETRLEELDTAPDPLDELLAELEGAVQDRSDREPVGRTSADDAHRVRTPDGALYVGSWLEIVRQLRDASGRYDETVAQFMRRQAREERARNGTLIPADEPEAFLRASARAGRLSIDR